MTIQKVEPDARRQIRIGLLGSGFMGKCHTNAYKKISYMYPGVGFMPRLSILCSLDERIHDYARRYGYESYCTDWKDLVNDERVDVFDNCGPDPLHPDPCIAALKNGKHVICEKPMAILASDARRMRDAAASSTGKAICVFNYRFMPAVQMAKNLISSGEIGTIYHMRVQYLQMAGHDPCLKPEEVWYSAWPRSGGLQAIGSHAIDQCRYLVGEIKTVSAVVRTFNEARALPSAVDPTALADEGAAAVMEFENGALGVMESSVVATGRRNFLQWEINGSKGSLKWDLEHPNSLWICIKTVGDPSLWGFTEVSATESDHPDVAPWWPQGHNLGWEHAHIIQEFHFLEAVANGNAMCPNLATFEDGYRVAVIIEAIRESSRSGSKVAIHFT